MLEIAQAILLTNRRALLRTEAPAPVSVASRVPLPIITRFPVTVTLYPFVRSVSPAANRRTAADQNIGQPKRRLTKEAARGSLFKKTSTCRSSGRPLFRSAAPLVSRRSARPPAHP